MRCILLIGLVACADSPSEELPPIEPEALPTPRCGERAPDTKGCSPRDGLCFGRWGLSVSLFGAGDCIADPRPGTVTVSGDVAFDGIAAAGVRLVPYDNYLEVSARGAGGEVVAFTLPAVVGTFGCWALGYFVPDDNIDYRTWQQGAPQLCTVTVQTVGEIGGRITGTFAGTLYAWDRPGDTIEMDVAFDVERVPY